MNDRFKFRAMTEDNVMVYGNLTILDREMIPGALRIDAGCYISGFDDTNGAFSYKIKPETIMQSTGCTDRYGKLIYEGDILYREQDDVDFKMGKKVFYQEVYFDTGAFCLTGMLCHAADWTSYDRIIAGNKYENPELKQEIKHES